MNSTVRSFLAIDVDSNLINKILDIQNQLKSNNIISNSEDTLKYVNRNNFHFTLKFFGDVNNKNITDIKKSVDNVLNSYSKFTIDISGFGAFPNKNKPRVLWIGIDNYINNCNNNIIDNSNNNSNNINNLNNHNYINKGSTNINKHFNDNRDNENTLSNLQKELDTSFSNIGFKKEKNYKSHITIARVKYINNKHRTQNNNDFLNELKNEINIFSNINIGKMTVSTIYLKKSELSPSGPIYTNIKTFELN